MKQIFCKGDEVKHPKFGEGIVMSVVQTNYCPVGVMFRDGRCKTFTLDGRLQKSYDPTLTFRDGTQFDYGTPPERKWIPTESHWAKVWGSVLEPRMDKNCERYIINYSDGITFPYEDSNGAVWKHAEPCDPPEWKGGRK